jgi:hypothetical protein
MKKLDILGDDKKGDRYHWYAIDIDMRAATGETCCSISGKGALCDGFKDEESAKKAGYVWKKTQTT